MLLQLKLLSLILKKKPVNIQIVQWIYSSFFYAKLEGDRPQIANVKIALKLSVCYLKREKM
ncbi:MAG: hypothetical protein EBZ47_06340 [Chlamydiae bacterium]|nr:hypothetical protein [Chlamydiota bacterium]